MAKTKYERLIETIELVKAGVIDAHPLFLQAPTEELMRICNGCGAEGKIDIVPDTNYGLDMSPACYPHDFAYHIGTTKRHKVEADRQFLTNQIALINRASPLLRIPRRYRAMSYYGAVCDFGDKAFWAGKD